VARVFATARRRHNLPAQATPLVGREQELEVAHQQLLLEHVRLLTLTGPGGSGKTRLALAVAENLAGEFVDGVWLVDLTPLREPSLVLPAIARVLGLREAGQRPILDTLCQHLCEQHVLLVLDNCEHVLEAAPQIAELLGACRQVKVLAASREPLRLRWEHELPIPPLPVPDLQGPADTETLGTFPSVDLFVQRARAVDPAFTLTDENAHAEAGLCVRLDGLPLALELAAARARLLPPGAMLLRLEQGLPLLASAARDRPARHRTLGEAIRWSYDLLDQDERALFRRLSIFIGGCTLDAVEAVCGPRGAEPDGRGAAPGVSILEGLASLAGKSLLRREDGAVAEPRFGMLETIREFAREELQGHDDADAVALRHASYYRALAEDAGPRLYSTDQHATLTRLALEGPNIRAAVAWCRSRGAATELWTRLAMALGWLGWLHDDLGEGRHWLELVIATIPADSDDPIQLRIRTNALNTAGMYARGQGDYERAIALLDEGLAAARRSGDRREIAFSLIARAAVAADQVDGPRGTELSEEAIALCRELGEEWLASLALYFIAFIARGCGAYLRAEAHQEESLALRRSIGDTWGIAWSLHDLGLGALDQGDHQRAALLLSEGLTLFRQIGHQRGAAWCLNDLAVVALAAGDTIRARQLLAESLILRWKQGDKRGIAECLEHLGALARTEGDAERGARLLGVASAVRAAIGTPCWPVERARQEHELAALRRALGEAAFDVAWAAGRQMALESAIDDALANAAGPVSGVTGGARHDQRSPLTPREYEVATLVARGNSNRQIAEVLVISPHTAARHVEHILAKLDCSSRAEVAAWIARHGDTAEHA
jgi:predicted ATPase/DNA-binding CsgD family transcriptional regulator